jgi:hypothetical protein
MSLVLQSSGGGQITIQEPATASNFTQTLPAADGTVMVSGNQPAFSASNNANQTISGTTFTRILFQTEEFDTNNNFASSRFTPTVAGYYQINAGTYTAATATNVFVTIYKNGVEYIRGPWVSTTFSCSVSALVQCNGSTDYIEIYVYMGTGQAIANSLPYTFFQGALVRAA